jgi:plastocyanin
MRNMKHLRDVRNLILNRCVFTIATRRTLPAMVVLALLAGGCSSSSSPSNCGVSPTNPEGTNPCNLLTVTIKGGVYSPNPVMVKVGQSVNWLNSDSFAHTATDPGVFDTGSIAPTSAADAPVVFNTVGTFNYHCTLHANETASIVVTASGSSR